ncbi:MAG TPA: glycosyltransferase [Anaerolineae bacterium]|nr:glycosyltransferase [Anaerolineae bacterium]
MNILHIYKDYFPVLGGIENHIRVLAEASAARGQQVTVLVTSLDRRTQIETLNGVSVIKTGRWLNISSAPISPAMFGWARRLGRLADIVHLHSPYPPGETLHLFSGSRAQTVITYHSDIVRQKTLRRVYRPLLWRVLARADRIIATSPRYIDTSPFLQRFRDKCTVAPLGVDLNRFAAADPARVASIRNQLTNQPTRHVILSVGKLRHYKGFDTLIEALPDLLDARLVIVGSGPLEDTLRECATLCSVADRVTFAGEVPDADLPAYYHAADLFVLPANARAEAFGAVLVEAMAAGLACVTTEVGTGTSWVVQDGVTGLVVPPRDPALLAQAIRSLLANADRRRQMGQAGIARARAQFDEQAMIERVHAVYTGVRGGGKQVAGK